MLLAENLPLEGNSELKVTVFMLNHNNSSIPKYHERKAEDLSHCCCRIT